MTLRSPGQYVIMIYDFGTLGMWQVIYVRFGICKEFIIIPAKAGIQISKHFSGRLRVDRGCRGKEALLPRVTCPPVHSPGVTNIIPLQGIEGINLWWRGGIASEIATSALLRRASYQ